LVIESAGELDMNQIWKNTHALALGFDHAVVAPIEEKKGNRDSLLVTIA
jgi:hypothetical protein